MSNRKWLWVNARRLLGWAFPASVLLVILDLLLSLSTNGIQKWIIDDCFVQGEFGLLPKYLLLFAALIIAVNVIHLAANMVKRSNVFQVNKQLAVHALQHLHHTPVRKYQNERIGRYMQIINNDTKDIANLLAQMIPNQLGNMAKTSVLILIIGTVSPIILTVIVVSTAFFILLGMYFAPLTKAATKEIQESRLKLNVHIEESISSSREVIAFHRGKWEREKYDGHFSALYENISKRVKLNNLQLLSTGPFRWIIQLTVLGWGGYEVLTGSMSIGTFIVTYQFSTQLMDSSQGIYEFFVTVNERMVLVQRHRDFVEGEKVPARNSSS